MIRQSFAAAFASLMTGAAFAAPSMPVHKATLQSVDFPPPIYRTVTVRTVVDPGGEVTPHTHPGQEMAFVVRGTARLAIAGSASRSLGPGDSFSVRAKTVHSVRNIGSGPLTIVSTYVVDKSVPLSSPAPHGR